MTIHTSRTAPYGYHIETEIVGTKGAIRIGQVPAKNGAVLYTDTGVGVDCVEAFPERFERAFLDEKVCFVDCVRNGKKPEIDVIDGVRSAEILAAVVGTFSLVARISFAHWRASDSRREQIF